MGLQDGALAGGRGSHRDLQPLRQLHHFALGTGGDDATTGHDDRPLGRGQQPGYLLDSGRIRLHRSVGGKVAELLLDDDLGIDLPLGTLTKPAGHLYMGGPRRARHRLTKGLLQQVGEARGLVDAGVELGDLVVQGVVLYHLIEVLVAVVGMHTTGEGDHRGAGQEGIPEAGGQVGRTHLLRHAEAGPAASAGVSVGHVGGRHLVVGDDTLYSCFVESRCARQKDSGHVEYVADAVTLEGLGKVPSHGSWCHVSKPPIYLIAIGLTGEPAPLVNGITGATSRKAH